MQSIRLFYTHLRPIQTPLDPVGSPLMMRECCCWLQQVNEEGPKVLIIVADSFYFAVWMFLWAVCVPLLCLRWVFLTLLGFEVVLTSVREQMMVHVSELSRRVPTDLFPQF